MNTRARTKKTHYLPGFTMHWIQARKAWEDEENWRPGHLTAVLGRQMAVDFADGSTSMYWSMSAPLISGSLPVPAFVNERWHVLAIGSADGNVIGVGSVHREHGVFAMAGERQMAFLSIALPGEPRSVEGWQARRP